MKKTKIYLLILFTFISLMLVGCAESTNIDDESIENTGIASLSTDQDVMLFSTLSSANVLTSDLSTVNSLSSTNVFGTRDKEEIEVDMEKVNEYLLMMENLLADGGPIVVSERESDREDYDNMMVVSVKDLAGNVSTYTIYYSIVTDETEDTNTLVPEEPNPEVNAPVVEDTVTESVSENTIPEVNERFRGHHDGKTEDDDEKTEDDKTEDEHKTEEGYKGDHHKAEDYFKNHHYHEKDEREDEIEYELKALAVIDDVEYEVIGKKEIEEDEDETEVEITLIVKLDDKNYVRIDQEVEDDEIEYQHTIYKDGRKYSSIKLSSEEEFGTTVTKITTSENGYKETYKFYKSENKTIIKYSGNGYSYTLFVTSTTNSETGEVTYEYKAKEKEFNWEYKKEHKGHR